MLFTERNLVDIHKDWQIIVKCTTHFYKKLLPGFT